MFEKDNEEAYEEEKDEGKGVKTFFTILFFPAVLFGLLVYGLLRFGRLRFSVIASSVLAVQVLILLAWWKLDLTGSIVDTVTNYKDITTDWPNLILPLVLVFMFLGGFIGLVIVFWELREMRNNPHRLVLPGNWMYKFQFRRTPRELMKKKELVAKLQSGALRQAEKSPLGLNEEGEYRPVYRYQSEANKHTLIVGNSGSGKTITMQSLILSDIQNRVPLVLIDMKRSPEFASKLAKWTKDAGGDFYHFVNGDPEEYDVPNSPGQAFYDPLAAGTPTAKADMVLGMREYDTASAVYKANMQQLLQVLFPMLKYADKKNAPNINWDNGGIYQLASAISGANITELAAACEGTPIEVEAEAIDMEARGKTGIAHSVKELQGQMRTIVASEYGRWLRADPSGGKGKSIDLFKLTQQPGAVILFSLNSDSEPDFARFIGSMIMSDITNVSARRRNQQLQNQVNVYIDEFQAINPSSVAGLLEKSRESKIAMTLAQQSFEQIVASTQNNGEAYLLSIMDTCSNFIVHAGSTEDSAERLAKILGKEWVDAYRASNKNKSFFLSGNFANKRNQTVQTSREERWKFAPVKFMELLSPDRNNNFKATAVVVNKTCSDPLYKGKSGAVARTVWMIPPSEVLEKYYTPTFQDDVEYKKTLQTKMVEADADEVIVPNEYDLLAERAKTKSPIAIVEDEEDEDGGFGYEVVEDDEGEDDFLDLDSFEEDKPVAVPPPSESKRISARETSSFMKATQAAKETRKASPPEKPVKTSSPVPLEKKEEAKSTKGLPRLAPPLTTPRDSSLDEIELPDLGF